MTGNLAALVGAEPEDLLLYPAECADPPGTRFVLRSRDDEPWAPVSFGQLADGTPYLYMSGRVAPASAEPLVAARESDRETCHRSRGQERAAVTRGWCRQAGMVAM